MAKKKTKPVVAVVGRPNVGKSTLFNVLAGERISIVQDTPGVTRDRIYADVEWLDTRFTLIDTGGIEPDSKDIIVSQMREQAQIAIDTADVIMFMVDVKQGLTDSDSKVADMLRRSKKPVTVRKVIRIWRTSLRSTAPSSLSWISWTTTTGCIVRAKTLCFPISMMMNQTERKTTEWDWSTSRKTVMSIS